MENLEPKIFAGWRNMKEEGEGGASNQKKSNQFMVRIEAFYDHEIDGKRDGCIIFVTIENIV